MKGLFIPEITAEEFRNGSLESIEALMAEGEIYDIEYSRWIPVSERLPEVGQYVLCYLKGWHYLGKYRVCKYRDADKYVNHPYFDFNENGFPDVLAWMPLPEPYKEVEE